MQKYDNRIYVPFSIHLIVVIVSLHALFKINVPAEE